MAKANNKEMLNDYKMLQKMSKELTRHQSNLKLIRKAIAKGMKTDLKYGLIENIDTVLKHMGKASKEMEDARKELKMI